MLLLEGRGRGELAAMGLGTERVRLRRGVRACSLASERGLRCLRQSIDVEPASPMVWNETARWPCFIEL